MEVSCIKCGLNMGVIRDAKLRKGWQIVCHECAGELTREKDSEYVGGFKGFNDLFKNFGGKK